MIHRIRVQNFKSLRDVTVEFSPVTVLIGKSGTGKTNFASAIRFLRDFLVGRAQPSADQKCATSASGGLCFKLEFDIPGFTDRFAYTMALGGQETGPILVMESLDRGTEVVFRQTQGRGTPPRWEKSPALLSPPKPGPLALGGLPGLEEAADAYTVLTAGMGVYAFPYSVLTTPTRGGGRDGLADDAGNYLEVLREVTRSLQDITTRKAIPAALRRINPTVASVQLDSIQNPTKVTKKSISAERASIWREKGIERAPIVSRV